MTGYPIVSCLCPTKNRRRYVGAAIRQFLAQDYPGPAELILVEDGEDNCSDLILEGQFQNCHPMREGSRIRYFRHEGTLGKKLNFAASMAYGDLCCNWDDDDFFSKDRLTKQVAHQQMTGAAVAGMSSLIYYREGDSSAYEYTGDAYYATGGTLICRRDWVLAHPHPDMTCGEDSVFVAEARAHNQLSTISRMNVMVARNHESNSSARQFWNPEMREFLLSSDNWREVPVAKIAHMLEPILSATAVA